MVIHIALFKWCDSASEEEISRLMDEIKSLEGKINEIIELYCGKNFSKWARGYTHAVIVKVKDRAALESYRNHPLHILVAKTVDSMEKCSIGIDFEI